MVTIIIVIKTGANGTEMAISPRSESPTDKESYIAMAVKRGIEAVSEIIMQDDGAGVIVSGDAIKERVKSIVGI